jgi:hypothetical protein
MDEYTDRSRITLIPILFLVHVHPCLSLIRFVLFLIRLVDPGLTWFLRLGCLWLGL